MKALLATVTLLLGASHALNACEFRLDAHRESGVAHRESGVLVLRVAGKIVEPRSLRQHYVDYIKKNKGFDAVSIITDASVTPDEVALIKRVLGSAGVAIVSVPNSDHSKNSVSPLAASASVANLK